MILGFNYRIADDLSLERGDSSYSAHMSVMEMLLKTPKTNNNITSSSEVKSLREECVKDLLNGVRDTSGVRSRFCLVVFLVVMSVPAAKIFATVCHSDEQQMSTFKAIRLQCSHRLPASNSATALSAREQADMVLNFQTQAYALTMWGDERSKAVSLVYQPVRESVPLVISLTELKHNHSPVVSYIGNDVARQAVRLPSVPAVGENRVANLADPREVLSPEPTTVVLFGTGLLAVGVLRRKKG